MPYHMSTPTVRPHLSFSQLKVAAECGEEYRLKYVEGFEDDQENVPALVGSAFHAAAQEAEIGWNLTHGTPVSGSEIFEYRIELEQLTRQAITRLMREKGLAEKDLLVYGGQTLTKYRTEQVPKMVENYMEQRQLEVASNKFQWAIKDSAALSTEVPCEVSIDDQLFVAHVDQVFHDSQGRVVIRDLKTGKPRAGHAVQLELYRLALFLQTGIQADYGQLFYVKGNSAYMQVVDFTLDKNDVVRMIRRLLSQIGDNAFTVNGPFTDHCKICSVRSHCVYGNVGVHGSS